MIWHFEKRSASTLDDKGIVYDRKMLQPYQISCLDRSVYYASWHTFVPLCKLIIVHVDIIYLALRGQKYAIIF